MAGKATLHSTDSLKNRDLDFAHQIIAEEQNINNKRFEIGEKCIEYC
jgi:phosphate uptake regulator